jgi:lipoyl(octanoyl) transferase
VGLAHALYGIQGRALAGARNIILWITLRLVGVPEFLTAGLSPDFVPYLDGLALQRSTHKEVVAGTRPDTVILLEHESTYTAGKRTEDSERPTDGTSVIDVDRGGKITWHGPGQLVGYPIMRLPDPIDVVGYVRFLEQVLIDVCSDFGLATERVEGRSGVWAPTGDTHVKIAAIGIRVAEHTTMHGFALNCSNSLEPYDTIVACGIKDAATSTISALTGELVTPAMAAERVKLRLRSIAKVEA